MEVKKRLSLKELKAVEIGKRVLKEEKKALEDLISAEDSGDPCINRNTLFLPPSCRSDTWRSWNDLKR